ncbi:uncharacterized protein [Castor canadensis]|uniref:Uncharacterized protein n=1 Tax=Castor canadensis TaxID=51338 RepID=A0AC58KUU1_CASCN
MELLRPLPAAHTHSGVPRSRERERRAARGQNGPTGRQGAQENRVRDRAATASPAARARAAASGAATASNGSSNSGGCPGPAALRPAGHLRTSRRRRPLRRPGRRPGSQRGRRERRGFAGAFCSEGVAAGRGAGKGDLGTAPSAREAPEGQASCSARRLSPSRELDVGSGDRRDLGTPAQCGNGRRRV